MNAVPSLGYMYTDPIYFSEYKYQQEIFIAYAF